MWLRSSRKTQTMSRKRFVFSTGFIFFRNYSNTNTQMPKQMSRLRRILAPASLWNTKSACGTSSRNPTRHLQQRFYVIIIINVINVTAIIITMMSNITKVVATIVTIMIFILRWSLWSRSSLWLSPQLGWLSTRCRKSNTRFVKTVPQDHSQSIILIKNRTPRETPLTIQSLHWSRLSVSPGSPSSICSGAQNLTNYIFILVKLTNVQICRLPKKVWVCEKRDECDRRAGNPSLLCLSLHYGRGRGCQLCQCQIIATWTSR